MPDESLILLAKEVRARTLWQLQGVSEQQARFAAPGLCNSILWHAGHSLLVVEHLCVMRLSGSKQISYPPDWWDKFGWQSDPRTVTTWPTLEAVRSDLAQQLPRLITLIESADETKLAQLDAKGRPLRYEVVHGLHDEALHAGEVYLLRKMLKRNGAGEAVKRGDAE